MMDRVLRFLEVHSQGRSAVQKLPREQNGLLNKAVQRILDFSELRQVI